MQPRGQLAHRHLLGQGDLEVLAALALQLQAAHLGVLPLLAGHDRLAAAALGAALGQLLLLRGHILVAHLLLGEGVVFLVVAVELHLRGARAHIHRRGAALARRLVPVGLLRRLRRRAGRLRAVLLAALALLGRRTSLLRAVLVKAALLGPAVLLRPVLALAALLRTPVLLRAVLLAALLLRTRGGRRLRGGGLRLLRRALGRGLARRLLTGGLLGRARLLGGLPGGFLRGFLPGAPRREVFVEALHLVLVGVVVEDHAELLLVEGGHALALPPEIRREQVDDLLARNAEILRDLVDPVLFYHRIKSSS